ncbi:MAG: hypothetical protein ACTHU0_16530 [Kofleriaceae bacterium]
MTAIRPPMDAMSPASRRFAGILVVVIPTVIYGGTSLLWLLTEDPSYAANPLRQNLWRAGHAHAGVLLILSLVVLRYVDDAVLAPATRWMVRLGAPIAAILIPAAFFLSMPTAASRAPSPLIYLAYAGAAWLALCLVVLGIGLIRRPRPGAPEPG